MRFCLLVAATVAVCLAPVHPLPAQIRASEPATLSQTVDGTTITLTYSRPQTRGRDSIFGGLVHYGELWTPGANWATTLTTDRAITMNGHAVPAGSYSVWFEIQPRVWTVVLDPEPRRFHLMRPPASEAQIRFTVEPTTSPPHETLTWLFTDFRTTGTTLHFAWADRGVTFEVGVEPSQDFTVPAALAKRFVGSWQAVVAGDTLGLTLRHVDGHLRADWTASPALWVKPMWLLSLGEDMFHPVILQDGAPFDVVTDLVMEFTPLGESATTLEVRGPNDMLMGTGHRAP